MGSAFWTWLSKAADIAGIITVLIAFIWSVYWVLYFRKAGRQWTKEKIKIASLLATMARKEHSKIITLDNVQKDLSTTLNLSVENIIEAISFFADQKLIKIVRRRVRGSKGKVRCVRLVGIGGSRIEKLLKQHGNTMI